MTGLKPGSQHDAGAVSVMEKIVFPLVKLHP